LRFFPSQHFGSGKVPLLYTCLMHSGSVFAVWLPLWRFSYTQPLGLYFAPQRSQDFLFRVFALFKGGKFFRTTSSSHYVNPQKWLNG
jgi:hypothetical protein